jgi:arylsulfatase A-like enzyme
MFIFYSRCFSITPDSFPFNLPILFRIFDQLLTLFEMTRSILFFFILLSSISCKNNDEDYGVISVYKKLQEVNLPEKPNILWITCEDQMPTLGCYGDPVSKTPNLDKLAQQSIRFTNAFSTAGVCAPSRATLITGMYQNSIGTHHMRTLGSSEFRPVPSYSAVIPDYVKCYSEILRENGYYCTNNVKQDYQFMPPVTAWDESSREAHWKNRPEGKPFFAIFNITVCHESGMWRNKDHPLIVDPDAVSVPPYYPDNEIVRNELARNYSNLYEMDSIAGIFLNELESAGLMDNTIIFFYSDHGGPLPRQKREIYDTGLKVPLIIRFPDQQMAGTVVEELVSFVDFAPTLLSLTNVPIPDYMQGQAFLGKQQSEPRKYIYAARDRLDDEYDMVRGIRDKRFKYFKNFQPEKPYIMDIEYRMQMDLMQELIRAHEAGELNDTQELWFAQSKPEEELYDLETDPYELHNLIDDPAYVEKAEELRTELQRWMDDIGDMGFIPEDDMISRMWEGRDHPPITENPEILLQEEKITIQCPTSGASIGFKIIKNGMEPESWQVYTGPFELKEDESLRYQAQRIGYEPSPILEYSN